jgi:hypothetical protein
MFSTITSQQFWFHQHFYISTFLNFFAVLVFELKASCLLGRCSYYLSHINDIITFVLASIFHIHNVFCTYSVGKYPFLIVRAHCRIWLFDPFVLVLQIFWTPFLFGSTRNVRLNWAQCYYEGLLKVSFRFGPEIKMESCHPPDVNRMQDSTVGSTLRIASGDTITHTWKHSLSGSKYTAILEQGWTIPSRFRVF